MLAFAALATIPSVERSTYELVTVPFPSFDPMTAPFFGDRWWELDADMRSRPGTFHPTSLLVGASGSHRRRRRCD
jgi:hypothetical protein